MGKILRHRRLEYLADSHPAPHPTAKYADKSGCAWNSIPICGVGRINAHSQRSCCNLWNRGRSHWPPQRRACRRKRGRRQSDLPAYPVPSCCAQSGVRNQGGHRKNHRKLYVGAGHQTGLAACGRRAPLIFRRFGQIPYIFRKSFSKK